MFGLPLLRILTTTLTTCVATAAVAKTAEVVVKSGRSIVEDIKAGWQAGREKVSTEAEETITEANSKLY